MGPRHLSWLIAGGLVVAAGLAWLAFGDLAVQTLFIGERVDENIPVFAPAEPCQPHRGQRPLIPHSEPAQSGPATETSGGTSAKDAAAPAATASSTPRTAAPPATTAPSRAGQVVTLAEGTFVSGDHPTSGRALVLNDGSARGSYTSRTSRRTTGRT